MGRSKFIAVLIAGLLVTCNLQLVTSYAEADIAVVEKPFMEGRYDKAISEAQKLIDGRARRRDEVYYLKGLSELKLGKFNEARQSFETIISKYPNSGRAFDAHLGIGDSYLLEGNTESAIKMYAGIKEKFPSDKNIALVDSRLNDCRKKIPPDTAPAVIENKTVPKNESTGYVSVQAGCFKNRRNADKLSAKLNKSGYKSYVELPAVAGDRLYRVKVGRMNTKAEAEGLAAKLKRDGYNTKICDENACQ